MEVQSMKNGEKATGAKRVALMGMLFALAVVLSFVEGMIPIPIPIPGVRLGLANIVVMFALLCLRKRDALALTVLKAGFALATRGVTAGLLSLAGGTLAFFAMLAVILLLKEKSTYLIFGVVGAVFHNIGQFVMASFLLETLLWPYLPVLLLSGIATGFATSVLLKLTSPAFSRLHL